MAAPRTPLESMDFGALMQLAVRPGEVGRPVTIAEGMTPDPPLDDAALARLGRGADLAFEHGARSAALVMGGRIFRVDVHERRLVSETSAADGQLSVLSVDVAVAVPDQPVQPAIGPPAAVLPPPGLSQRN